MATISFNNNGISQALKNKERLKGFLISILIEEGQPFKQITFIFCKDEFLLKLNKKYLDHDTFTDILTFTLSGEKTALVSEIYISVERVRENAVKYEISYLRELYRVMIHGILHLCGYSDHNTALKAAMREREDFYLEKMYFT
ncbi:MAG: rRNA maturation RNase YbeY [Bacteroidota bacterium]|nr:rRNA maturation RNase YbeY [Bacteroidota bacterium]